MFRLLIVLILMAVFFGPVVFFYAAVQPAPVTAQRLSSSSGDASRTRQIVREFRALTQADGRGSLRVSEQDINSVLGFSFRALPFLRGRASVTPGAVRLLLSADARGIPGGGWLNLSAAIEPSPERLEIKSVRIGPFDVPASLVLPVIGATLDLALGDGLGKIAVESIDGVSVDGRVVEFGIGLNAVDREALSVRVKQTLRSVAGVTSQDDVKYYYRALDEAVAQGQLARGGSLVPYLRFAMAHAHQRDPDNTGGEVKSALLALAVYCGHAKFQRLIGEIVPKGALQSKSACGGVRLAGRGDLRQHFTISAGLKAIGDSHVSFAIGEFKELLDSARGGSGFSFDDIAADRAGIRFAAVFLAASPSQRRLLISKLNLETDIMPETGDLPSGLGEAEFRRRFGGVDAPNYRAMLAKIDQRLDQLALYARQNGAR